MMGRLIVLSEAPHDGKLPGILADGAATCDRSPLPAVPVQRKDRSSSQTQMAPVAKLVAHVALCHQRRRPA